MNTTIVRYILILYIHHSSQIVLLIFVEGEERRKYIKINLKKNKEKAMRAPIFVGHLMAL